FVAALGRNMTGIRPRASNEDGAFIAAAVLSPQVRREIELRTDAGTIMNALNVRSIPHLRLPKSTSEERRSFPVPAAPLLLRADQALREARTLARSRDALLPEFLSGRIPVRGVDEPVGEGRA